MRQADRSGVGSKNAVHQLAIEARAPLRSTYVGVVALPSAPCAFACRSASLLLALALIALPDCRTLTGVDDLEVVESSDAADASDARAGRSGARGSTSDSGSADGNVVAALSETGDASADPERCIPNCDDKLCGDDGCEGSCGQCGSGERCHEGECVAKRCEGERCQGDK
jgi:hypothetical protein